MATTKKSSSTPSTDFIKFSATDFDAIRGLVRKALLVRGIESEEVNSLMRAFRTVQPVYNAATQVHIDPSEENLAKAREASAKAVAFLKGKYETGEVKSVI